MVDKKSDTVFPVGLNGCNLIRRDEMTAGYFVSLVNQVVDDHDVQCHDLVLVS